MASLTFAVFILSAVLLVEAGGHGQGQQGGSMSRGGWGGQEQGGAMSRGGWGGQEQGGQQGGFGRQQQGPQGGSARGRSGWGQEQGQQQERGWQGQGQGANGRQGDSGRYRTNLFNDEDVYGYDASYPNGQALYVNYRNSEARGRRGPEFARSNSISARNSGGMSQYGMQDGGRQQRGAMERMGMMQGHPMGQMQSQW